MTMGDLQLVLSLPFDNLVPRTKVFLKRSEMQLCILPLRFHNSCIYTYFQHCQIFSIIKVLRLTLEVVILESFFLDMIGEERNQFLIVLSAGSRKEKLLQPVTV